MPKPGKHGQNISAQPLGFAEAEAAALRDEILNTPNTEELYSITGTKYYISASGNDNNDGTTPETAFRTAEVLDCIDLESGDAVLFERGSVFRFYRPHVACQGVVYGSYGIGAKPEIYTSPANYAEKGVWKLTDKANIWAASFPYADAGGMVFDHGNKVGALWRSGIASLKENGQFHHDNEDELVYLYSDKGDPAEVYSSIEIMPSVHIFRIPKGVGQVTFDNLCLKYTGGFAITGADVGEGITVTNCEMGYIGGLYNGTVRFGNAFEIFTGAGVKYGARNVRFEHNWVYQTFDSAVTWQGHGGEGCLYENISFSNNLFEYNNADIEFFERKGAVVKNFRMENNIMRFTGMGWGTQDKEGGIRGIEGCVRCRTLLLGRMENISFKNNTMDCPARQIINWTSRPEQKSEIQASDNRVFVKSSYRTTSIVVQGLEDNESDEYALKATDARELEAALGRFDKTAKVEWYD